MKKGDLIAELDSKELEANLAAARANVTSLESQVNAANHNYTWTNDQTGRRDPAGPGKSHFEQLADHSGAR